MSPLVYSKQLIVLFFILYLGFQIGSRSVNEFAMSTKQIRIADGPQGLLPGWIPKKKTEIYV